MNTTTLSSKGQVIIPKPLRDALHWEPGQQIEAVDVAGVGILLKPVHPFSPASLDQVAACLPYSGPAKTLADMEKAIEQGGSFIAFSIQSPAPVVPNKLTINRISTSF